MPEEIKIRVVIEEVVVDFHGSVGQAYAQRDIEAIIKESVEGAVRLHKLRKPKEAPDGKA